MEPNIQTSIKQLNDARNLVLSDAAYYQQILPGILPVIQNAQAVEIRRWGAEFLAEMFASPAVSSSQKEALCLTVLETLRLWIESEGEDAAVVRSVVQCAASVYPLVVRWTINNAYDKDTWERMAAIKSRVLRIWDSSTAGVRVCCIKFAQRVVMAQTAGPEADPRRADVPEVSLSIIPSNHVTLKTHNLEAEASGLLDRMLAVFHENSSDAVSIDATLNSLSILIRTRPQTSNKILNAILNFNPLKQANSPMTPKSRVVIKSMEKTTRMLLIHLIKRDPQNPQNPRIHQYIERMMRSKSEIFDDMPKKRGPPEPTDGLDPAKRQKLAAPLPAPPKFNVPSLSPGPHTVAELFTVTTDDALKAFDVALLPEHLVVKIGISLLQRLDANVLSQAVEGIKNRYDAMLAAPPVVEAPAPVPQSLPIPVPAPASSSVEEDEDDYDPDFSPSEDAEQILNKQDTTNTTPEPPPKLAPDMDLGRFKLPPPPQLSPEEALQIGQGTVSRVFGVMKSLEEPIRKSNTGLNRLAASSFDREAWLTILTRLATRATGGLGENSDIVKAEEGQPASVSDTLRESLYMYVLEDFRKRIDVVVTWLCEEWYNDQIQLKMNPQAEQHYEKWALRVLNGIVNFLDARDKILTRFLSEIPALTVELLQMVKDLCRNPVTINLSLTSLLYLVMFRPPVRDMALDAVEDIWAIYDDAKPMAAKYLSRWRPGFDKRLALKEKEEEEEVIGDVEQKVDATSPAAEA